MQKSANKNLNWDDLRFFLEVARAGTASAASRRLSVDYTTVARRIRSLEESLGALLFDKSRSNGFTLTVDGQHLVRHADTMEAAMEAAMAEVSGTGSALSGHVRIGCTEAFGTYFVAPHMVEFQDRYPNISIDILPVPHFVNLSRREADIAITLERPARGPYISSKLCDYRLKLYATPEYLAQHPTITCIEDLTQHRFINYVNELAFSAQLLYLDELVPGAQSTLRSTSALAQYHAVLQGRALAILPCFIADTDPRLVPVLNEKLSITRQFWLSYSEDLRRLKRVTEVAQHLVLAAQANNSLLMGSS
ncbi:MAG: LysR family transcriptional regulator [Paraperlucidibaca sp.]|nr:LysR family transcriptional regulator [Paraperlucidibaca sp.]